VVTRWTARGTHEGEYHGIPPSGKEVTFAEVAIYRMADGKIAEQWGFPDVMDLLRQIGARLPDEPA
jgi:predicted ester cyclase